MKYEELFILNKLPAPLSKEESILYFEKCKQGDMKAREYLIVHNIKLVFFEIIRKFQNTSYNQKELFSIGLLGLIKSVDTFDIAKNFEFSTYAVKCIDNEILIFLKKENKFLSTQSIYFPIETDKEGNIQNLEDILKDEDSDFVSEFILKCENQIIYNELREVINGLPEIEKNIILFYFGFVNNRMYTQREIAEKLNLSQSSVSKKIVKIIKKIEKGLNEKGITAEGLVDKPIINDDQKSNMKKIITKKLQIIYATYLKELNNEYIDILLNNLPEIEKKIILLYFGLVDNHIYRQKEIIKKLNLSQTYVSKTIYKVIKEIEIYLIKNIIIDNAKEMNVTKIKNKKLQMMYEYLKDLNKKDMDILLGNLSELEKNVFLLYTGLVDNHVYTQKEISEKLNLSQSYVSQIISKDIKKIETCLINNSIMNVEEESKQSISFIQENLKESEEKNKILQELELTLKKLSLKIEKKDYLRILKFLRTVNYSRISKLLTPKEVIILGLKLGIVDGKSFTIEDITKILEIDNDEVLETTTKLILLYKENINQFINENIEVKSSLVLKKKK